MTENLTIADMTDDTTAQALVATIRAAVNGAGKYAAFVEAHNVTRENVKEWAHGLAVLAYPKDAPVQKKDGKRTRFGNAVQAAGNGLRAALAKEDKEVSDTDYLAALVKAAEKALANGVEASKISEALSSLI